jgi:hypothetical protein
MDSNNDNKIQQDEFLNQNYQNMKEGLAQLKNIIKTDLDSEIIFEYGKNINKTFQLSVETLKNKDKFENDEEEEKCIIN